MSHPDPGEARAMLTLAGQRRTALVPNAPCKFVRNARNVTTLLAASARSWFARVRCETKGAHETTLFFLSGAVSGVVLGRQRQHFRERLLPVVVHGHDHIVARRPNAAEQGILLTWFQLSQMPRILADLAASEEPLSALPYGVNLTRLSRAPQLAGSVRHGGVRGYLGSCKTVRL